MHLFAQFHFRQTARYYNIKIEIFGQNDVKIVTNCEEINKNRNKKYLYKKKQNNDNINNIHNIDNVDNVGGARPVVAAGVVDPAARSFRRSAYRTYAKKRPY